MGGAESEEDSTVAEIVPLDPDLPRCDKPARLPHDHNHWLGVAGRYSEGRPALCGGVAYGGDFSKETGCVEYAGGKWKKAAFAPTKYRRRTMGLTLGNGSWLLAGAEEENNRSTTDVLNKGGQVAEGPDLKEHFEDFCLLQLRPGYAFVAEYDTSHGFLLETEGWNWNRIDGRKKKTEGGKHFTIQTDTK